MEIFTSIKEAQLLATKWKEDYNENRPHSALNYMTPNSFAASREAVVSAGQPHGKRTRNQGGIMNPQNSHNYWTKNWGA